MALAAVVLEVERVAAGDAKLGHRRGREHEDGGVLDLAHRGPAATGDRLGTEFRIGALAPVLELAEVHAGVLAHARDAEALPREPTFARVLLVFEEVLLQLPARPQPALLGGPA